MKLLENKSMSLINGGFVPAPIAYGATGCGCGMIQVYVSNPSPSARDYQRGCFVGTMHSMNPAFGMVKNVAGATPYGYALGSAYGMGVSKIGYMVFPKEEGYSNSCSISEFTRNVQYVE